MLKQKPIIIFGGAGFIGTNVADQYLTDGYKVRIFDNLSRPGVEENIKWLLNKHGSNVDFIKNDIRNTEQVNAAVKGVSAVFNFAAQVAVTTSLDDPIYDLEVNIRGTVNVLEALRRLNYPAPLLFTSTNKVYGGLADVKMVLNKTRYYPLNDIIKANGINESRPLDFHSPYGCSKGSADQYVLDYSRSYNMPVIVFRMSCIYGPHQFGNEDQGWVAHFLIQTIKEKPIVLYGDGKQVRDILNVEDLVRAFVLAQKNISKLSGNAYNIGGGVKNTVSLVELLSYISELTGIKNKVTYSEWRTGDQKYYVSDISKFRKAAGWDVSVNVQTGVANLYRWLLNNYPFSEKEKKEKAVLKTKEKKVLAS